MAAFLLAWNPKQWSWDAEGSTLVDTVARYQAGETVSFGWSCGRNKSIKVGDTVFLIRLGKEPKGVFATGTVTRGSYKDKYWNRRNKLSQYVDFQFSSIVNPETDKIISRESLDQDPFSEMHWSIQGSGVRIPDDIATALSIAWSELIGERVATLPDELSPITYYHEGAVRLVAVNSYERNTEARKRCIQHYGARCWICEFDFLATYGEVGRELIHVHHLVMLSSIGEKYQVDPINDLIPVCPNCHAIIHRRSEPYSIEEVRAFLRAAKYKL